MSKSQNTKNEQQNDLCITSEQLTEQLKKGELPKNFYYVDVPEGSPIAYGNGNYIEIETPEFGYLFYIEGEESKLPDYVKVLAPVPSYEQLKSSDKLILTLMDNIKDKSDLLQRAIAKNEELKELLKEVLRHELSLKEISELTKKISEALGE